MIINLDNYEQWLTMYVDNELSAADRERVESFLREHPYLQEELEMLEQTKLSPELISFSAKSSLLKPMLSEEAEEKMLLQLDGELDRSQAAKFEKEIAADKLLAREWQALLKTKLDPSDTTAYPYKEELYRKEESRVIRMPFLRWAAAAILIGAGFYLGSTMLRSDKTATSTEVATTNDGSKDPTTTTVVKDENVNGAQKENNAVTNETNGPLEQQYATTDESIENKKEARQGSNNLVKENISRQQQQKEIAAVSQPKKDINKEKERVADQPLNKYEQPALTPNEIAALEPRKLNNTIELNNVNQVSPVKRPVIDEEIRPSGSGYAQTASLNFDDNNDNSVFLMDEDNISRSKAGILLKKLKRNVERRANLKPGKSLRIAGFEFAAK